MKAFVVEIALHIPDGLCVRKLYATACLRVFSNLDTGVVTKHIAVSIKSKMQFIIDRYAKSKRA